MVQICGYRARDIEAFFFHFLSIPLRYISK